MNSDTVVTMAWLLGLMVLFAWVAVVIYPWAAREFWIHRYTAFNRMRERGERVNETQKIQLESLLSSLGRDLVTNLSNTEYLRIREVFGELSAVRAGLARYGEVCFQVLHATAAGVAFGARYRVADQDPVRKRARLQVIATAQNGIDIINHVNQGIVLEPLLVSWRVNLQRVRYDICPNCPVVSAPDQYPNGCPVMLMAGGEENAEIQKAG